MNCDNDSESEPPPLPLPQLPLPQWLLDKSFNIIHEQQANVHSPLTSKKESLSIWGFCCISFFLVCGGPFGLEATIIAGGPLLTLIGFFVMPIVWSIPQALMTAELSCLIKDNGGYVIWVHVAFGELFGWLAALNGSISMIFDLSLYPSLAADYFQVLLQLDDTYKFYFKVGIVLLCIIVNVIGLRYVGIFSACVTVLVIFPFIISATVQFDKIIKGGMAFTQIPNNIDWGVFLSTLLWSYSGWDSLGCLAGEVADPSYTYTRGPLITLILVICTYSLPTIISIQTHPDLTNWFNGSFSQFAFDVNSSLGTFTVIACIAANIGMFVAGLSASSRAMSAMAHVPTQQTDQNEQEKVIQTNDSKKGDSEKYHPSSPLISHLPSFFALTYNSSPIVALLVHGLLISALFSFDFKELVQADMVLTCVRLMFEFGAFLQFRYYHSEWHRDFIVPGGWYGAFLITLPKVIVVFAILCTCDRRTWFLALAVNFLGIATWAVRPKHSVKKCSFESNGQHSPTALDSRLRPIHLSNSTSNEIHTLARSTSYGTFLPSEPDLNTNANTNTICQI